MHARRLLFLGFVYAWIALCPVWADEKATADSAAGICNAKDLLKASLSNNLIENGSFEDPQMLEGSWAVFRKINGWVTLAGPGIEIQNHVAGSPFDGAQHIELDSHSNSMMEQTIAIEPHRSYCLKFAYSARPDVPIASQGIRLWIDKKVVKTIKRSGKGLPDTKWEEVFVKWTNPTSTTITSIRFEAIGQSDGVGGYIDAVEMYALPP